MCTPQGRRRSPGVTGRLVAEAAAAAGGRCRVRGGTRPTSPSRAVAPARAGRSGSAPRRRRREFPGGPAGGRSGRRMIVTDTLPRRVRPVVRREASVSRSTHHLPLRWSLPPSTPRSATCESLAASADGTPGHPIPVPPLLMLGREAAMSSSATAASTGSWFIWRDRSAEISFDGAGSGGRGPAQPSPCRRSPAARWRRDAADWSGVSGSPGSVGGSGPHECGGSRQ